MWLWSNFVLFFSIIKKWAFINTHIIFIVTVPALNWTRRMLIINRWWNSRLIFFQRSIHYACLCHSAVVVKWSFDLSPGRAPTTFMAINLNYSRWPYRLSELPNKFGKWEFQGTWLHNNYSRKWNCRFLENVNVFFKNAKYDMLAKRFFV